MSITLSPAKATYLTRVAEGLSDLPVEDREEVIQDLEAHLGELQDDTLEQVLGTPEAFVAEFRQSAGLVDHKQATRSRRSRAREDLNLLAARLSEITHWQTLRPVWIWTRGWLLVCAWSLLYDYGGFERFPIPDVAQSTKVGLAAVVGVTALSVWLANGTALGFRAFSSVALSIVAGWALVGLLLNPMPTSGQVVQTIESQMESQHMIVPPDGKRITNIYAYDLEGSPVDVLLFDQDGRPLLTFPPYVYEDAEMTGNDPAGWELGSVDFVHDEYGRIIPNLYPLELAVYGDSGMVPMQPPSLGFRAEEQPDEETPAVPTTLVYVR